ncbi:MAG: hypothetical protein OEM42_02250 [Deltaproteobacteria bacterium]|nr:hypothetical protein [Deltaproteobacteria bacterium]MDH3382863.1 hypothetical protein [Deltaproteobacteria bacterium]
METGSGRTTEREFSWEDPPREGGDPKEFAGASSPSWRALVLSVIAAILLSVTATLLLGGSFGFTKAVPSTGCGPESVCCPPAGK